MPVRKSLAGTLAAIGLGANLGDSLTTLQQAWIRLGRSTGIRLLALSSPYRTEPLDMESDNWFINAAGLLDTDLTAEGLLMRLLETEQEFGRVRVAASGHQDRTLDLDLIFYGARVIRHKQLHLPHPEMCRRLFVLAPLAEVCPDWTHPVLGSTVTEMRDRLSGEQQVIEKVQWP